MSLLYRILSYPKRLRTSKGFGVHSPFAFSFITKVLKNTDTSYYAYANLKPDAKRPNRVLPLAQARRLLRILCYFNPADVVVVGETDSLTRSVVEEAFNAENPIYIPEHLIKTADIESLLIDPSRPVMLIIGRIYWPHFTLIRAMMHRLITADPEVVVFISDMRHAPEKKLWLNITNATQYGMGFDDLRSAVFVSRRTIPHQIFEIT